MLTFSNKISQPFVVTLREYIANPPPGSLKMLITPEMALEMLTFNTSNRPVTNSRILLYANQMTDKKWRYTRVPIIFSDAGRIIDGQHRLHACLESGVPFTCDVAFGAPDEAFAFIDVGKTRSPGDIFFINGVSDAKACAAIARWVLQYLRGHKVTEGGNRDFTPTAAELYEFYCQNPDIKDGLKTYNRFRKNRLANPAIMAGCYVVCARKSKKLADEFFECAADGFGGKKYSPAIVLRESFISYATKGDRMSRPMQSGLTITAWNRARQGLSGRGMKFDLDSASPRVR